VVADDRRFPQVVIEIQQRIVRIGQFPYGIGYIVTSRVWTMFFYYTRYALKNKNPHGEGS
jgi:hypothetical protein